MSAPLKRARPRAGLGLTAHVAERDIAKRVGSSKPERNRNRVKSAAAIPPGRRPKKQE
jgi:hypothetical protein